MWLKTQPPFYPSNFIITNLLYLFVVRRYKLVLRGQELADILENGCLRRIKIPFSFFV